MLRCSMNIPELGEFSFSDGCQRKINHIKVCFTKTVSEVRLKFPQFDMNLAIACSCQSKMQNLEMNMYCKLHWEVVQFAPFSVVVIYVD